MKTNRIVVVIKRPIEEVFEFTTNPKNTHLWIPSIQQEVAEEYPPRVGTQYRNRGKDSIWSLYKVVEFEKNKVFLLSSLDGIYFVRYSYREIADARTEMEYLEWVENGELKDPFADEVLQNLKAVLEKR